MYIIGIQLRQKKEKEYLFEYLLCYYQLNIIKYMQIFNSVYTNSQKRQNLESLKQLSLEQIPYQQIISFLEKGQPLKNIQIFQTIDKNYGFDSENYEQYKQNTNYQCSVIDYSKWLKQQLNSFMMNPQKFLMQKNMKKAFITYPRNSNKIKFTNVSSFKENQKQWLTNIIESLTREMLIKTFKIFQAKTVDIPSIIKDLLLKPMKFSNIGKIQLPNEQNLKEKVRGITKNIMQMTQFDALAYIADNIIQKSSDSFSHRQRQRVEAQKLKIQQLNLSQKDLYEMKNMRRKQYQRRQNPAISMQYKETHILPNLLSISDEVIIDKKPTISPHTLEKYLNLLKNSNRMDIEKGQQSVQIIQQNNKKYKDKKQQIGSSLAQNKNFSEIQRQILKRTEDSSQMQIQIKKRKIRIMKQIQPNQKNNIQTQKPNIERMDIQSQSVKSQTIKQQIPIQEKEAQRTGFGMPLETFKRKKHDQQIDKQQGFIQKTKYRFKMLNQPIKIQAEQNPLIKKKQQIDEKIDNIKKRGYPLKVKSFKKFVDPKLQNRLADP